MRKINILLSVAFLFFLTGCATKITTRVTRPAELDLNGATSLSVLPFQPNPWDNQALDVLDFFLSPVNESLDKRYICEDITNRLTTAFVNTEYMQMVSSTAVQNALKNGRRAPCDVYLSGYISQYDERFVRHEYEDDDGRIFVKHSKEVNISIVYEVIDSTTNRVISRSYRNIFGYSGIYKSKYDLPTGYEIIRYDLRDLVDEILRKIQPYTVTVTFKLLEDKTKDSEIQAAHRMAENHNLRESKDMFIEAYKRTGNFECAYNAAILLEAMQRYDEAEKMMQTLYKKTYDKRAERALQDIRYEKRSAAKLNAQEAARSDDDDDFDFDFDDDDDIFIDDDDDFDF